ncbi:DUF1127 domain-containing protein [Bradyrhizobium sp. CB82]|uniref:DUF1127 domain-containing protein n=1 Tax=Bradyrhizobium sp. CB82 TaxID=3039159 RepID=UPI0024B15B39|nr:DUF1127 domain-containing protein [Bradyrhizobium sp. CB82]WFU38780.1 DUF1127 domain-containing protein [Bradyrhizobium sp. CB82]
MSTTYSATAYRRLASARRVVSLLERYWEAFQERRKRTRLRGVLSDLADRELMDIGISRGEIDYVASNPNIDPRGARSIPPTMI